MRHLTDDEMAEVQALEDAATAAARALDDRVARLRRECRAPSDVKIDSATGQWCSIEQGPAGARLVPLEGE